MRDSFEDQEWAAMTDASESETKRLREQLQEHEERLRLALQAAKLGAWEHVPNSGVLHWDARCKQILGFAVDRDVAFEDFMAAVHPDDIAGLLSGINKATDPNGSGECSLQYRVRAGGEERWVEAHGRCAFVAGVPKRINGTLLDITERKRSEDALEEAVRRKDEFLALLGHELRNPLAPIRTAVELMRVRYPELAARELDVIERQLRYVTRLVDDLLDISRVTRGTLELKLEVCELATLVREAITMVTPLLESRRHRLEVELAHGVFVDADPLRFTQIVANLLNNAAKFTPAGGAISVRSARNGDFFSLTVTDNGSGIEAHLLDRIFEPFVQGTRAATTQGGLGLGLALVKRLVELHGGSVEATSAGLGQGSTFSVRARIADSAPRSVPARVASEPARVRRILVVDDNEDAAELLGYLLGTLGHTVCVANNGLNALERAAAFAPEVAVVDLGLPLMDGYELAGRLREVCKDEGLRLIALTGYGQPEDRARTRAAGFDAHLVKPVEVAELEAVLG
ncbi:MAG TPA: ATP-binding protein [Polyangiaceae bacterium]|nr:ATP-binding protein [Polyangiaceae bacterium]